MRNVLTVVVALACIWAAPAAALAAGLTLPALLVPGEGTQIAYIIYEQSLQEVGNLSGLFQMVPPMEETRDERAVRVHYTVLSAAPDKARLLVRAQPIHPQTRKPLSSVRWEAVYLVDPDGVYWETEISVPDVYADLVEPSWLADWSAADYADLPQGEIEPGESWTAPPGVDLTELFPEGTDVPLTGEFVGWQEIPGAAGPVAHLVERLNASTTARQEVFEGIFMDQAIDMAVGVDHWLIPGGFPYGLERSVDVTSRAVIGPRTGAPEGVEGTFDVIFHMAQSIEVDPHPDVVWLEWEGDTELTAGETVWSLLGPWSEQYDDGTYMEQYVYRGRKGENLTVRLHSPDFDAYLFLFTEEFDLLAHDDDSGGGTDALITYQLPRDGNYIIVVNTVFEGEEGRYALTVE